MLIHNNLVLAAAPAVLVTTSKTLKSCHWFYWNWRSGASYKHH